MICGMTYYQICWYFLIYSFGGWALEVVYHAVACGKVINRGFLNGPVCPVYGFGVLSVFAMMNTFQGSGYQLNDGMIFLFGVILATAVGVFYKLFYGKNISCKMVGLFQQAIEFSWIYLSGVLIDLGSGDSACCESISVFGGTSHFCARAIHCGLDGRCHTLCIVSGGSYSDRCGYSGTEQETYEAGYNSCQHAGDQ